LRLRDSLSVRFRQFVAALPVAGPFLPGSP
jgi:hypothetical protein